MGNDTSTSSVAAFTERVIRSGLLTQEQLKEILRDGPLPYGLDWDLSADASVLAERLVEAGRLSRFQAHKLLQGKTRGLVLGPYQVLAPIGKGGMSTVYLARDSRNQQLVALKVLPPKQAREEDRHLARFRREMELCQRVEHPNIARTFEVGESQGVYYIAMEFIRGRSLGRLVREEGTLDVARAAHLFAQAAAALDHAHERGVIHRDLKPSNIMVTRSGNAKVLDLGLALIEGEIATDHLVVGGQGYVVGTMDYIAPEQSEDPTKVCPRSDIYGLGCTLYFALTGRPPFPGGSAIQKIKRHRTEEPQDVEELNARVPAEFAALVRKMMAKRPEDRFDSAADVRYSLLRWESEAAESATESLWNDPARLVREVETEYGDADTIDPPELPFSSEHDSDTTHGSALWTYVVPILIGGIFGLALVGLFFLLTS